MMIQSILLILPVLSTSFAAKFPKPVTYETLSTIKYRSPNERRKVGLFPKSEKKFVITEKPTESEVKLFSEEKYSTRPLMPKLIIKNKDKESTQHFFYIPVTRRPLMKYKKFTVEPTTTIKFNYATYKNMKKNSYQDSSESSEENQDDFLEFNDEHSSEVENFKSDEKVENVQESVEVEYFTTESELANVLEINRLKLDNITADTLIGYPKTYEEKEDLKEDLKEFIFVNNIMPRSVSKEKFSANSSSSHHRVFKRAVNVIDEENLGTTVAAFKFTGRATYLTNDLNYKNINS